MDKICIPIEKLSQTICTGYSGTGWTFINPIDNRHYLHGIISLAPYNVVTKCAERPALCTNVSHYYNFIKGKHNNSIHNSILSSVNLKLLKFSIYFLICFHVFQKSQIFAVWSCF